MITHTIQRWFQKLFAWWPWRRAEQTDYRPILSSRNSGSGQEALRFTTVDGPVFRPESSPTSVAVEQTMNDDGTEERDDGTPERSDVQVSPPTAVSPHNTYTFLNDAPHDMLKKEPSAQEQSLRFLRYLVQRGIVNEGFREDQIPEQYRRRRQ